MTAATTTGSGSEGEFAHRMIGIVNDGAIALLMSIGHRTGLFDVLADRPRCSAEEIAAAANLSEPNVREWLDAMVRGGIVSHDPGSDTYELPAEHAACLSHVPFPKNLAALAEYVPLLCAAEDRIVERFQKNGRTPYDARPSFRQLISKGAHASDRVVVETMVNSILPLVPGLLDGLRSGIEVLDIGCGKGRAVNLGASTFPKSRFRGYDPSEQHIDRATWRAFELGLTNVSFHVKNIAELDEPARYDLITDFDTIRGETKARRVLENVARALRPGGTFLMQEVVALSRVDESLGLPPDSPLCTAASLAETPGGVGALTSEHDVRTLLREAGFENVIVRRMGHHIYNCYFIATRGSV
jgi:SAM-dependent methyltransferase